MDWATIIILIVLLLLCFWAFVSWIIRYHIKKYSVTARSSKILGLIYIIGSAIFFGFVFFNALNLILALKK